MLRSDTHKPPNTQLLVADHAAAADVDTQALREHNIRGWRAGVPTERHGVLQALSLWVPKYLNMAYVGFLLCYELQLWFWVPGRYLLFEHLAP